jgi:hypothetical protein
MQFKSLFVLLKVEMKFFSIFEIADTCVVGIFTKYLTINLKSAFGKNWQI